MLHTPPPEKEIIDLEDIAIETIQTEAQRGKKSFKCD